MPFEYRNHAALRNVKEEIQHLEADDARLQKQLNETRKSHQSVAGERKGPRVVASEKSEIDRINFELKEIDTQISQLQVQKKKLLNLVQADNTLNKREQDRQLGNPLKFGDEFQLKHKYSDMFVCASESKAALVDHNAARVYLQEYSDKSSFFKIMSNYKVRSEGDQVRAGDQVRILMDHIHGYGLTASDQQITKKDGNCPVTFETVYDTFEVCLSARKLAWTINIYASIKDDITGNATVKYGDIIQLTDKEIGGIFSAAEMIDVQLDQEPPKPKTFEREDTNQVRWVLCLDAIAFFLCKTNSIVNDVWAACDMADTKVAEKGLETLAKSVGDTQRIHSVAP